MKTVELQVSLGNRSYMIPIGSGYLDDIGKRLGEIFNVDQQVVVVTDSIVAPIYLKRVEASLRKAGFRVVDLQIPAGEQQKNLPTLASLYDGLLGMPIDRSVVMLALGGGVVGDLTGFTAATVLRGVDFVQVPTTLLAQVDASVGGKTGINHSTGKNLIGAFYQPKLVLIDPDTLRTLPRREYAAGLAEVVKYGASLDALLFERIESSVAALLDQAPDVLSDVIARCCEIKAMVVHDDEREQGRRAVLNFGHTIGHAIEALTEYRQFLHGEAVSIGMVAAARLSVALGFATVGDVERLQQLLTRMGLPIEVPAELDREKIALAIESDKKASGGLIRFVVMKKLGTAGFDSLSAKEIVDHAIL